MRFYKKVTITLALTFFSIGANAETACSFAQTVFGADHKIDQIVLQQGNPGQMSIHYQDGTTENLAPESGVAGLFNEIKFKPEMSKPVGKKWTYAKVTSNKLGVIQMRFICYFEHSDIFCASMSGNFSEADIAQFNIGGQLLSFDGKNLPLCPKK